jgi:hypothetical protein
MDGNDPINRRMADGRDMDGDSLFTRRLENP